MERIWSALGRWRATAPLVPVALGALAGATWVTSPGWALALALLALVLAPPHGRWWLAVSLVVVTVGWRARTLQDPVVTSLAQPRSQFVTGTLVVGPQAGSSVGQRFATLTSDGEEKRVMLWQAGAYRPGDRLAMKGRFFVPKPERNPGTFSELDWWKQQGVQGGVVIEEAQLTSVAWTLMPLRWAEHLRALLAEGITRGLPRTSKGREVIQAMVLGDKPPRDSETSRAFRESGAMHVFAVSGLHVTLVGLVFWLFLRPFPVQRRMGLLLVMLAMLTYALVTGFRPPAVRATVMAVCFLGAFFFRRRPSLFNALALSLILVVLWNPLQVQQVGFQLSYGVLLAIGLGVGVALRFTGRMAELDPFFPSRLLSDGQRRVFMVRRYFANLGASSLAAWLGSLPIMIWHFGVVTPVAVFTSVVLIPATMLILSLAFLGALTGALVPVVGRSVNHVNGWVAGGAFEVARGFSRVPMAHWKSERLIPAGWVIFDAGDGGAASYLQAGSGVMVEAGSRRFHERQLQSILASWQVEPSTVLVTHPDGGHVGGLPRLLERGGLGRVVLPVPEALSPSYREFLAQAAGQGCRVDFGKSGDWFDLGDGVRVEVLQGAPGDGKGTADQRMMVMKVHWKGWRVLVTGDLGMRGELALLRDGTDLSADVVWMGRHEWGVSGQHQFLAATGARVVITSAARLPEFERPPARWVAHVEKEGYELFHQGETGAVLMDFEEDELRIKSYLQPEKEVVLQR